jgi:hypothetical protein
MCLMIIYILYQSTMSSTSQIQSTINIILTIYLQFYSFWYSASLSNVNVPTNSPMILNEKVTIQPDHFIHYLAEKLPEIFVKFQTENSSSDPIDEVEKKRKLLLSSLLHNYLQTMSQMQASTQVIKDENNTKLCTSSCSASTNT